MRWLRCGGALLLAGLLSPVAMAQTGSVVTVNSDNALVVNGQKKFLVGFSPGPPNYGLTPDGVDALQELRGAGALLFRINQSSSWNSQLIATQQAALDWAEHHDMFCWVNLAELSEFAVTDTNTAASLRNVVDTFRNHPALGLWKNFDEAWHSGISVSNLLDGYNVIKQEDTNHPVVQTHAPRGTVSDLQPYNVAADILALDNYPVVASGSASNPPITNTQISQMGDWTEELAQIAGPQKEYWLIEQIAFSGTTPPGKTLIFPTYRQSRFMAYQVINDGARGLLFFGGNITATLTTRDAALGWNWTFWTNVLRPLVQQLGYNGALANGLVSPASSLHITIYGTSAPDIEFCVREVPPYIYLLASKREGATVNVTFSGLPSWAATGEVLFESPRTVTAQSGQFTDSFAPLDVHVYRFAQTNVAPPFLSPPQDLTVLTGTTADFWASADGTGPLSYQWTRNGTNLSDGGNIAGSTSQELTLTGVSQADAAAYAVVVSGFGSVTSAPAAMLTVVSNNTPLIIGEPQSTTNFAGTTASFSVAATGTGTLYYQWLKNSENLSDGGNVSGSQTPVLTLTGISAVDAGSYSVIVSNLFTNALSSSATLTVIYPLPYYEGFDYPAGEFLGGQVNGEALGWSDIGTSTPGDYVTVAAGNLQVPGLAPSTGNCVQFGGQGKSARLSFPTGHPVTSGTLYYSFALQVLDTTGLSPSGVFVAGFNNSVGSQTTQPTAVGTRVYLRATNGGFNVGTSKNSSTVTDWVWDPRTFTTNDVLFIVGSYTFNDATASDDVSKMWINPEATNFGASMEPTPALITSNGSDITANQIASMVLLQRVTNEPPLMLADELRIGTTWASVTPPPSPIILTLTGLTRAGSGVFQFSYTNTGAQGGSIYVSTDLSNWTAIGVATLIAPGVFQFTDSVGTNYGRRFYQLRSP